MLVFSGAFFGLLIGSFLNVVIWRVPRGESLVRPPSACPGCGTQIRRRDNVPVISWVLLGRRCRDCGGAISARYPAVELLTAGLFGAVVWWLGLSWATPAFLYLAAICVALALIDLDVQRLPNAIVLPAYPVSVALLAVASWTSGDLWALARAMIGGAALYGFYFALMVVYPRGMGFGDVKLAGIVGLYLGWVGWGALIVGAFGAFLLGGVFAIGLLASRRAGRGSGIPFGPWMILGCALGVVVGEPLWMSYLGVIGL